MKNSIIIILLAWGHMHVNAQEKFTLDQAVDYALNNHNNLKSKQIDVLASEQQIKEFRSIGMPKVSGGVDYSYYFAVPAQPVEDFISPSVYGVLFAENVIPERDLGTPETFEFSFVQPNALTANIGANMILFDGGYLYGLKAAKLYRELIVKETEQTKQEIKSQVTKAYMSILIAEENKKVISQNIAVISKSLSDTKAIYENGFAESLDVDRLQLSLETLETEVASLDQVIQLSYNLLKFQMNYPLDKEIGVSTTLTDMVNNLSYDGKIIAVDSEIDFSNRTEFALLDKGQELNELDLKRNKAGYLPTASAFINLQESLQRRNLFDNDEVGWLPTAVAGVQIKIPIYDGGEKSAKIEQVKLNMEKTNLQRDDLKRGIRLQVRNAQLSLINARSRVGSRKKNLDLSQKIYDKTKIKFTEGVGSSLEVTQAEASLYEAQSNYINALYDLLIARTDLDIALGTI